jgi:hypothetical protein
VAKLGRIPGNYRKWTLGVLAFFVAYSIVGFWVVPAIVARRLPVVFEQELGLVAEVGRLRTNPYTLALVAEGFVLREPGGGELAGFDELLVNFQLSSLFRWAWTFKEIRLIRPRIDVILHEDGSVNLAALVPDAEEPGGAASQDEPASIPRVLVHAFELVGGLARLEDRTRPTPFRTEAGPASFTLIRFSTLPEDSGELVLEAELESGARLRWRGTVGVNPVHSEGRIGLAAAHMPITERYLQDLFRFRIPDGRCDFETDYAFAVQGAETRLALSGGTLAVRDLLVTREEDAVEVLRLPELSVTGIGLEWPERAVAVREVALGGARLALWRNADGSLNVSQALERRSEGAEPAEPPAADEAGSPLAAWQLSLERLVLDDVAVTFEDRTVDPAFETGIGGLRVEVRELNNAPGSLFPITLAAGVETGGSFSAEGRVGVLPGPVIEAAVAVDRLSLLPLQAYVGELARLRIDSGLVSATGRLSSGAEEVARYRGDIELAEISVHDVRRNERLVALGRMGADDLLLELTRRRLRVPHVDLERPYGRVTIHEDGTTNVGDVFAGEAGAGPAPSAAGSSTDGGSPLVVEIGEVRIHDGSADFADFSLPLPFASRIDSIEGHVSEMATGGSSARVELEGTVDEHGLARIEGSLDAFAPDRRSDMAVAFRNVEMRRLTPYASKFAGYEVEQGRLSLNLRYVLAERQLESQNEILIEELTLGEKVESADAPNLPVKLAVALLKDRNGRIELDIPVRGTLDDPEFAYGKLVWQAVRNVLTKVATAPFRALAGLVGSEKDLEFVEFAAAAAEISPPAREKLEELARALAERPQLLLEVRGVFDPGIDAAAIRERKVEARVAERLAVAESKAAEPELASDRQRAALEALFLEGFPPEALESLAARHSLARPPAEGQPALAEPAQPVLDLTAYLDALRERLVELQSVSEEELGQLADARSAALRGFLTADGGIAADRVRTGAGGPIAGKDAGNEWVRLRLVLHDR